MARGKKSWRGSPHENVAKYFLGCGVNPSDVATFGMTDAGYFILARDRNGAFIVDTCGDVAKVFVPWARYSGPTWTGFLTAAGKDYVKWGLK